MQVGIISPLLFTNYMNSLIENVQQMRLGCSMGYVKFNIICCADDILLVSSSVSGLQSLIEHELN